MQIREATHADLDAWAALRHTLWPDGPVETARAEAVAILESPDEVCFLLMSPAGDAVGFIEGAVHPGPEGPYAHVEGWYVDPRHRGSGYGQELLGALEPWCLHRAIRRLTSDTTKDYPLSPAAHARAGFRTVHQFTIFMKELPRGAEGRGEAAGAPSESEAWEACDRKDFEAAASLWERLISECASERERDALRHGYGYALVGLKRFDEARALYRRLYERSGSHVFVHQLGMVEREAGAYAEAAARFEQERSMLEPEDHLALAANLYEQGLVEDLLGNRGRARELAHRCLEVGLATQDPVMHGCAWRLLGDLSVPGEANEARRCYGEARRAFEQAGDEVACREIDERRVTLG